MQSIESFILGAVATLVIVLFLWGIGTLSSWIEGRKERERRASLLSRKSTCSKTHRWISEREHHAKFPMTRAKFYVDGIRSLMGYHAFSAAVDQNFPATRKPKIVEVAPTEVTDQEDLLQSLSIILEGISDLPAFWNKGLANAILEVDNAQKVFDQYRALSYPLLEGMLNEGAPCLDVDMTRYLVECKKGGYEPIPPLERAWPLLSLCLLKKGAYPGDKEYHKLRVMWPFSSSDKYLDEVYKNILDWKICDYQGIRGQGNV